MKNKTLFKTTLVALGLIVSMANAFAQPTNDDEKTVCTQPIRKSKVPIWLNYNAGLLVADCYDNGTVPYPYLGAGATLGGGITVEWSRCHIQKDSRYFVSYLPDLNGFTVSIDGKTEFLFRCYDGKRDRFHVWAGGSYQTFLDIKNLLDLMNASTGISTFANIRLAGMLQYNLAYIRGGSHNLITLYGKFDLPLVGMVIRPGYAYMDNYTSDINLANTILTDYESFTKVFPGLSTDIGIYFNLINGNRIGLSYRWDYLTTWHKGIYRYDNALHTLNVNFMFNLN